MRKRYGLILTALLLAASSLTAYAESSSGGPWKVAFTQEGKLESGFATAQLADVIYGMQPGDDATVTLELVNQNSASTEWYMTNKILSSLEDSAAGASGGAYTYRLAYTGQDGREKVLFSSDTVGGTGTDAGEGLHSISSALEDYFYLDTLASGKSGKITLEIALDGETQGNDYQDTLADLQMNFAVELSTNTPGTNRPGTNTPGNNTSTTNRSNRSASTAGTRTGVVRTGDETNLVPLYIVMGITGLLFLILAIYGLKRGKKDRKGAD